MKVVEERIQVGQLRLHALRDGSGPTLLLLHGDGDSALDWQWVIEPLARRFTVVAPTLPGYGRSDPPPAFDPHTYVEILCRLLDALGATEAAVVGNSFGGLLATRLALAEPDRIRALVLVDSAGLGRAVHPLVLAEAWPVVGEVLRRLGSQSLIARQRARARQLVMFASPSRAPSEWLEDQRWLPQQQHYLRTTVLARRHVLDARGQHDLVLDELRDVRVPTLVVWGDKDAVIPPAHQHAALTRLQRGSAAIIPGAGHLPHVEQPARFLDAVLPFLAQTLLPPLS